MALGIGGGLADDLLDFMLHRCGGGQQLRHGQLAVDVPPVLQLLRQLAQPGAKIDGARHVAAAAQGGDEVAYLALFGSVVAFLAYLTLLKRVGAGPASFVGVSTPVLAMTLSTLFEGYRWGALPAAGIALAVAGNVLAMRPASR